MFPASTHAGRAVLGFPDVCFTPWPLGSALGTPTPYPLVGIVTQQAAAPTNKAPVAGGSPPLPSAEQAASTLLLVNGLNGLNGQLLAMPGTNPNAWHQALDAYVIAMAELYRRRASR